MVFMMNKLFVIVTLLVCFSSCGTNIMTMSVTEPPSVIIPSSIKRVGIVNRTTLSADNKVFNKIDEILSIEGKELDSIGAQNCILGLYNALNQVKRFEYVVYDSTKLINSALNSAAPPLTWAEVSNICNRQQSEVLFVLEYYDTDTKIAYSTVPVSIKTPLGIEIPSLEHQASVTTIIKTVW